MVGPPYVVASYQFNLGLSRTTPSASWASPNYHVCLCFAISTCTDIEKFRWPKLGASIITTAGAAIISRVDGKRGYFVGDALSLFGAMVFGIYLSVLDANAPKGKLKVGMMWRLVGLRSSQLEFVGNDQNIPD